MIKKITDHLTAHPSFLRWHSTRIAARFGCSIRTANKIKKNLKEVKASYEKQFQD